jgi:hypothetical protein
VAEVLEVGQTLAYPVAEAAEAVEACRTRNAMQQPLQAELIQSKLEPVRFVEQEQLDRSLADVE